MLSFSSQLQEHCNSSVTRQTQPSFFLSAGPSSYNITKHKFLPFSRGVPTSKSAVKRYPSMRRASVLLYKMSSFESKIKPKCEQVCLVQKHKYTVRNAWFCLTSVVTFCLGSTVLCKADKSLCVNPSGLPVFPINHFWKPLTMWLTLQKDTHPKGYCISLNFMRVVGEVLLRPWQCDIVLYWHHKNVTRELNYKCPSSDNSFSGACSFLGTKAIQLQYSSLTVIRLYWHLSEPLAPS